MQVAVKVVNKQELSLSQVSNYIILGTRVFCCYWLNFANRLSIYIFIAFGDFERGDNHATTST